MDNRQKEKVISAMHEPHLGLLPLNQLRMNPQASPTNRGNQYRNRKQAIAL